MDRRQVITASNLAERLEHHHVYLIHLNNDLIGEMNYIVKTGLLIQKRNKHCLNRNRYRGRNRPWQRHGFLAMQHLEEQIKLAGIKRIELGVFEFNTNAVKLLPKIWIYRNRQGERLHILARENVAGYFVWKNTSAVKSLGIIEQDLKYRKILK